MAKFWEKKIMRRIVRLNAHKSLIFLLRFEVSDNDQVSNNTCEVVAYLLRMWLHNWLRDVSQESMSNIIKN